MAEADLRSRFEIQVAETVALAEWLTVKVDDLLEH